MKIYNVKAFDKHDYTGFCFQEYRDFWLESSTVTAVVAHVSGQIVPSLCHCRRAHSSWNTTPFQRTRLSLDRARNPVTEVKVSRVLISGVKVH